MSASNGIAHFIAPEGRPIRVLLVDDQPIIGQSIRQMFEGEADIEFRFCPDPAAAIDAANEFHPTVILQDLVMPDVDGLLLVKYYRANPATRQTPLVVLSSKEEPVIKARAFALGANDYLVKLPDKLEVLARVRYHSRGYIHLLERNEAYRELAESQKELAAEIRQASRYVQSLLPAKLPSGPVPIDWRFVPSTQLAGDMFGYVWLDAEHLAIYLLDVSGHGVGSALLAVSAANLLAAQAVPNVDPRDPGKVITGLNDIFQMDRQDGKYFTIWYGVYSATERKLAYCNAGHPPGLLWHGGIITQLEADGPGVGMIPEMPFDTRTVDVPDDARLLIYSDGVFEIEKPDGAMWQFQDFIERIVESLGRDGLIDNHLGFARGLRGGQVLSDDFSMLEARFPHVKKPAIRTKSK
ncbi:MAG TPA: SpoIIE family protein phosphatase [Urbifossiella sp.]|nr:SpoIIE family protein phosphatase [Urbifossiella sp.]